MLGGLATPGSAQAACYSSTPASQSFTDPSGDAGSHAPDVVRLDVSLDAGCVLRVVPVVVDPGTAAFTIINTYINTDGSRATGFLALGADRLVDRFDYGFPALHPCGAASCDTSGGEVLTASGTTGFSARIDRLGVSAPTTLHFQVSTLGYLTMAESDSAPELIDGGFAFPVSFATSPPAPPPPPPPPPPSTSKAVAAPPPVAPAAKTCKVPRVRGQRVAKAKRRLAAAGCKYRVRGKGKVVSTRPAAGKVTSGTVKVRAKRGKRQKRQAKPRVAV